MIRKNGNYFCDKVMRQNKELRGMSLTRSERIRLKVRNER